MSSPESEQPKSYRSRHCEATARWDDARRKECEKLFALIRRGKMGRDEREALRELIRGRLAEVSARRLSL